MNEKIYKLIILFLLFIIVVLLRKIIAKFFYTICELIKNKTLNPLKRIWYKAIELIIMIILVLIMLLPIFIFLVLNLFSIISYTDYKGLLEITLNSKYITMVVITIIVCMFRKSIKKKIEQLKAVSKDKLDFYRDMQMSKEQSEMTAEDKEALMEYKYGQMMNNIESKTNKITAEEENKKLKQQQEEIIRKYKIECFKNLEKNTAKTTKSVLLYINSQYGKYNSFEKNIIEKILKELYADNSFNCERESKAIYDFLKSKSIIEYGEHNSDFAVSDYGIEFLKYLFEGGI